MSHVKILTASVYANSPLWHLSITPTYVFRVQFVFQNYNYALKVRFHLNRKKKKNTSVLVTPHVQTDCYHNLPPSDRPVLLHKASQTSTVSTCNSQASK